ncbi:MAG: CBS domain-containing protein [Lactobacillales bacterium]|jgi:predicted transcriptional regulator|nr:CBS domain-containing protein [Lactobacillales bacterium]
MLTKHAKILDYIKNLPIGDKISVRGIAKILKVSEGTAYRAIRDADNLGIVSTIERVGTIRIDRKLNRAFDQLTYSEVARITDSEVLGGVPGLNNLLNRFVIGAMKKDSMAKYVVPGGLMIVGNRANIQKYALEEKVAVLVTGGFEVSKDIIALSDKLNIPVMRTAYDTFTTASMINQALTEQGIKNEIMQLSDIISDKHHEPYLFTTDRTEDYKRVRDITGKTRIPIVDKKMQFMGMVAPIDVASAMDSLLLSKSMNQRIVVAYLNESVASVAHKMVSESIDMLPVVDENQRYIGVISLNEIRNSLRAIRLNHTQNTEMVNENVSRQLIKSSNGEYLVTVTPKMIHGVGTISYGVLSEWLASVAMRTLDDEAKLEIIIEQINIHFLQIIQLESQLRFIPRILESSRRSAILTIDVYSKELLVAMGIVSMQLLMK